MRSNRAILIILIVAFGLLAACGDDSASTVAGETADDETSDDETSDDETTFDEGEPLSIDRDALTASTWTLRFGGGPDGDVPVVDGWPITITFEAGTGTFGGTAACNGYGGRYTIEGSALELTDISWTEMGCEADVQASEQAYLTALLDVDGINLFGEELALSGMSTELLFARTEPIPVDGLFGQLWLLEALIGNGEETPVEGEPATLLIEADGSFTGSTGCRALTGSSVVSGNQVFFNEMAADGDCGESLADQDGHVVTVLGDGFVPTIDGDTLTVTSAGNEGLRYRAITEDELAAETGTPVASDAELLDGIEWTFVGGDSADGPIPDPRTIDPDTSITLVFTPGSYEGTVICNRYGGEADIPETLWTFTLGEASAEEEGCGDQLDEIAAAYLAALPFMNEGGIEEDGQALVMNGNEIELLFERTG